MSAAAPAGAPAAPPAPPGWTRLARVTWRQHRVALAGLLTLLGALCVVMGLWSAQLGQPVWLILQLVPALIAVFVTAPVLAREYERGTLRFAWTQGTGRARWVTAELLLITGVSATSCLVTAVLAGWLLHPTDIRPGQVALFGLTPVMFTAWAVFGSAVGAFAGTLARRTVPAMVPAAVVMDFSAGGLLEALGVSYSSGPGRFWAVQAADAVVLTLLAVIANHSCP